MEEPLLDINDIQGHILPGFASLHLRILGFKILKVNEAANTLMAWLPKLTTMEKSYQKRVVRKISFLKFGERNIDTEVLMGMSFSSEGLRLFNVSLDEVVDRAFVEGMHKSAADLNDAENSRSNPANWKIGKDASSVPDILFVLGSDDLDKLENFRTICVEAFGLSSSLIYEDSGMRFAGDKEHFGFKDAISQPAIRGRINDTEYLSTRYISNDNPLHKLFAKPGQPLVWPGQFIFGYPSQNDDPLIPNNKPNANPDWLRNGSFLVLRRLSQDVKLFRESFENLSKVIKQDFGEDIPSEVLQAKVVGRWPDGTPLTASPDHPNPEIAEHRFKENNFSFSQVTRPVEVVHEGKKEALPLVEADTSGLKCPHFAHIRKVNPRDDSTEEGTEKTLAKHILRRGINFGLPFDQNPESERGLLFMSYQTSIRNQFEFLQRNWANSHSKPSVNGHDLVIGQTGSNAIPRIAKLYWNGKEIRFNITNEWVFTTGGGYFFTPGITAIRSIVQGLQK